MNIARVDLRIDWRSVVRGSSLYRRRIRRTDRVRNGRCRCNKAGKNGCESSH